MANPAEAEISKAVRALVAQATGLDVDGNVIPGNDNHGAPLGLYATVLEIITGIEGIDSEVVRDSVTPNSFDLHSKGNRVASFSIQFYRDGAIDAMLDFLSYPSTSVGQIWLAENGITWKRTGDVRNIDSVMGSKYEQRRGVDVEIKYTASRVDTVNEIGSIDIEVNVTADGTDYQEELEVS